MIATPQRRKAFHDAGAGISVYACDDGERKTWIELETTGADGAITSLRITRAQASALSSDVLEEVVPHLRTTSDFERENGRPASLGSLSDSITGIKAERARRAVTAVPTVEEQQAARQRRLELINGLEYDLASARKSAGNFRRHKLVATALAQKLVEARALDAGLDLSEMEAEHEQVSAWGALLPEYEAKVTTIEAKLRDAYKWDGYGER